MYMHMLIVYVYVNVHVYVHYVRMFMYTHMHTYIHTPVAHWGAGTGKRALSQQRASWAAAETLPQKRLRLQWLAENSPKSETLV